MHRESPRQMVAHHTPYLARPIVAFGAEIFCNGLHTTTMHAAREKGIILRGIRSKERYGFWELELFEQRSLNLR